MAPVKFWFQERSHLKEPELIAGSDVSTIYKEVAGAAVFGLVINLILGVVKLVGGIIGNSFALAADAVNSLQNACWETHWISRLHDTRMGPPQRCSVCQYTLAAAAGFVSLSVLAVLGPFTKSIGKDNASNKETSDVYETI